MSNGELGSNTVDVVEVAVALVLVLLVELGLVERLIVEGTGGRLTRGRRGGRRRGSRLRGFGVGFGLRRGRGLARGLCVRALCRRRSVERDVLLLRVNDGRSTI